MLWSNFSTVVKVGDSSEEFRMELIKELRQPTQITFPTKLALKRGNIV